MRALLLFLFVASCSYDEPIVHDGGPGDPPPDESPPVTEKLTVEGTITTGGGALEAGALAVFDDGFETFDRFCAGNLCATGGVAP